MAPRRANSRWITQTDFTTGELDPRGVARLGSSGLERYPSALALARNLGIDKLGSMRTRGGLRWVSDVPGNARVQLVGWQRDDDDYLLALDVNTNLHIYNSADSLEATLAGAENGYVFTAMQRNDATGSTTAVGQTEQHRFSAGAGGHQEAFGIIEPPLSAKLEPGWSWSSPTATCIAAVVVRQPAVEPENFALDDQTFKDQAAFATTWGVASHTFAAAANMCLVIVNYEQPQTVSSVRIDPTGANVALAQLFFQQDAGGDRGIAIWGVQGTLPDGAVDVEVTFSGNASGSFEVISFIGTDALPQPRDLFGKVAVGGTDRLEIEITTGGFGESSIGRIDTASDSLAMLFFHQDVAPQTLHRTEADGWVFAAYSIEDFPYHRFQPPGVTLNPSGTTGNITLTTSAAHWRAQHVGSIVRYGSTKRRIEVTGFTSPTVVDATVLDNLPASTATTEWDEQVWSAGRGWPISGCWHQARLAIGGARDLKDGFWLSAVGESTGEGAGASFALGEEEEGGGVPDDTAIWTRIRADEGVNIQYVRSQGPLLILASGTEWIVPQQPLTPTNISFDRQASQGVARLKPADLDGAIIYLRSERAGEGEEGERPLIHFAWDELSQRYRPSDISVLNQHLLRDPIDMAAARGSTSDANNVLYVANSDGTIAALHLPTVERPGTTLFESVIKPYSVAVSAGRLYCAAEFNGAHRIFRVDPDLQLDASAEFDSVDAPAGTSIGDMTANGGLDVAFDGETEQTNSESAAKISTSEATIGRTWSGGATPIVNGFRIWSSTDAAFLGGGNTGAAMTFTLEASNDAFASEVVELGELVTTEPAADGTSKSRELLGLEVTEGYSSHRVRISYGVTASVYVSELEFLLVASELGPFSWLADQEVTVKGLTTNGWTIQTATADESGVVEIGTPVSKGQLGLPMEWRLRLLPPNAAETTIGSLKSPVEARVLVRDAMAVEVGDEDGRSLMTQEDGSAPGDLTTDPPTLFTGHLRDHLMGGWSEDPIIELGGGEPWPATILVFNVKVEF